MARSMKPKRKTRTMFFSVLLPMLCMVLLNMAIIFLLMSWSGVFQSLRDNSLNLLSQMTENKRLPLQQQMIGRWSDLSSYSVSLTRILESELRKEGATPEDMAQDAALNARLVQACAAELLSSMRITGSTGVFMVLDGIGIKGRENTYAGVYYRDTDPASAADDYADVLLERGLPPVARSLGLALDSFWSAAFDFGAEDGDYFFKPVQAAREGKSRTPADYGYWHGPISLNERDPIQVLTYTMPLIASDGTVLGVIGSEVTISYVTSLLGSGEYLHATPGSFVLARQLARDEFAAVAATGPAFLQSFGTPHGTVLHMDEWIDSDLVRVRDGDGPGYLYGSVFPLQLYNSNAPFEEDAWALIGLQTQERVMGFTERFIQLLLAATLSAMLLGLVTAVLTSLGITRRISVLVRQLRNHPHDEVLQLDHTGLREIDILVDEVMSQNRDAMGQALRLSNVLSMAGTSIGLYELSGDGQEAYVSRGVYQLLGLPDGGANALNGRDCEQMIHERLTEEVDADVWRVQTPSGPRYLRHKRVAQGGSFIGTLMDVTVEMENRYRVEHERDYDVLTSLLNRRALARICNRLFEKDVEKLRHGALLMLDLDNLKYINDAYGHDWGDAYIRCFADSLSNAFRGEHCVCGRRSGDEFMVLMYGWDDRAALEREIQERWKTLLQATIILPEDRVYRVQASGGMAWYPEDSRSFTSLLRFADFAMYKVKHEKKGMLQSFDRESYSVDSILMSGRDALRRMLDEKLVKYVYQPIVSARDGQVMGYEMLMRPLVPELSTPGSVLRVAKEQGMLHYVEKMTWFGTFASAQRMRERGLLAQDTRVFVNSLPSQLMDEEDERRLLVGYESLLPHVVMEITENEINNESYTRHKMDIVRNQGGQIAIDDYGTGYNSELALMRLDVDYVKLDISFVRNVDTDRDQQSMVKGLISYARRRGIAVLCEGVETRAEMETLLSFGVDYLQGFYFGRPQDEPQPPAQQAVDALAAYHARSAQAN